MVSSGGTAKLLADASVPVRRVSEVTGSPEILGGRVKTLHPRIHGGILARRQVASDLEELEAQDIALVDIVVVNFYPFEKTVLKGSPVPEVIENIDIGGPSMLRAAAKNFEHVLAVTDPADYSLVVRKLDEGIDLSTQALPRAKGLSRERALRRGDRVFPGRAHRRGAALVAQAGARISGEPVAPLREDSGPALRREPAPDRRFLPRERSDDDRNRGRAPAPRKGAFLQQHSRPRCRLATRARAPSGAPGCRRHQTHQSLRRRDGGQPA